MKSRNKNRRNFLVKALSIVGIASILPRKSLSNEEIARAWEDPEFRKSLTKSQWESLPKNPAGDIENSEFSGDLVAASGNNCSGNNCSGNGCSGNNCSGNNCSGNGCSGNNCSGNNCSGNNCSGNNCSGNNCSSGPCGSYT